MNESFAEGIESLKLRLMLAKILAGIVLALALVSALGIIASTQGRLNDEIFSTMAFTSLNY